MHVSQSDIELVKKFQGPNYGHGLPKTLSPFAIDPFDMCLLENYFKLLGEEEFVVDTIIQESYIRNILELNRLSEEAKTILDVDKPIDFLKIAVKRLAIVKEVYKNISLFEFY